MDQILPTIEETHYQFKIPGCASLIVPKEVASKHYKVEPLDEEPREASIKIVAKQIKKEIHLFNAHQNSYTSISAQSISPTLLVLFKTIDAKLENHLATLLIRDTVATTIKGGFIMLQLTLTFNRDS